LVENLLRVIAASFGDLPHSLNLFQSGIWEGSAGLPARKRHPLLAEVLAGVMMQVPGAFAASMGRLLEGLGVDPFVGLPGHDTRDGKGLRGAFHSRHHIDPPAAASRTDEPLVPNRARTFRRRIEQLSRAAGLQLNDF
jgi:hypothetical protein